MPLRAERDRGRRLLNTQRGRDSLSPPVGEDHTRSTSPRVTGLRHTPRKHGLTSRLGNPSSFLCHIGEIKGKYVFALETEGALWVPMSPQGAARAALAAGWPSEGGARAAASPQQPRSSGQQPGVRTQRKLKAAAVQSRATSTRLSSPGCTAQLRGVLRPSPLAPGVHAVPGPPRPKRKLLIGSLNFLPLLLLLLLLSGCAAHDFSFQPAFKSFQRHGLGQSAETQPYMKLR